MRLARLLWLIADFMNGSTCMDKGITPSEPGVQHDCGESGLRGAYICVKRVSSPLPETILLIELEILNKGSVGMADIVGAGLPASTAICNKSSQRRCHPEYQSVSRLAFGQQFQPRKSPCLLINSPAFRTPTSASLRTRLPFWEPVAIFKAVTIANAKSSSSFPAAG